MTGRLCFYSKYEATNVVDTVAGNASKYLKYKAKLIGNSIADEANGILRNTKIAVPF